LDSSRYFSLKIPGGAADSADLKGRSWPRSGRELRSNSFDQSQATKTKRRGSMKGLYSSLDSQATATTNVPLQPNVQHVQKKSVADLPSGEDIISNVRERLSNSSGSNKTAVNLSRKTENGNGQGNGRPGWTITRKRSETSLPMPDTRPRRNTVADSLGSSS